MRMLRIFSFVFALLFFSFQSFSQQTIRLTVNNSPFKKVYFSSIFGQKLNLIDSMKLVNNAVAFKTKKNLPTGMYRLAMADSNYVDMVIDQHDNGNEITLETSYPDLIEHMKMSGSANNERFYLYQQYKIKQMKMLNDLLAKLKPADAKKTNAQLSERIAFLKGCITWDMEQYSKSLINIDSNAFVSKAIKAMIIPNYNMYLLADSKAEKYESDLKFLSLHFYDNIDFSDSLLLRTEYINRSIRYYMEKIAFPRNVQGFETACDLVIKKSKANKMVNDYVLGLLLEVYEYTQLEDVFSYLYDNYVVKENNVTYLNNKNLANKINIINSLKPGKDAPDIVGKDTLGKEISLYKTNAKLILLYFWSSQSPHSDDATLRLMDVYTKYKPQGLEIFAFSTDTIQSKWKAGVRKHFTGWISVSDLKGTAGPLSRKYNVWYTPGFYFIDEKKKIIGKPMNIDYIDKQLELLLKK